MIAKIQLIVGQVKAGFTFLFAFELGPTRLFPVPQPFKEGRKGLSQIQKGLVRGIFRDFPRPGELLTGIP